MTHHSAARSHALEAVFALGLCLEEGAACCLLLVCTNPCLGSLVVFSGSSLLHSVRDMSRAAPSGKWQALDHASVAGGVGSHLTVGRSTRDSPFSSCAGLLPEQRQRRLLVCRAGSLLVGVEAHTAFIFVACVT